MNDDRPGPKGLVEHASPIGANPWFSTKDSPSEFVSPSLNQVRIGDLPGLDLPANVRGRSGYELLSAAALGQLVRKNAASLALEPETPDLLEQFDHCFEAADPAVRSAAADIAAVFGKRLGYLLLTLHGADAVSRRARPQWGDEHWAFWQTVRHAWVGGGLVSGRLGLAALPHAQTTLRFSNRPMTLDLAGYPALLPLLGAARHGLNFDGGPASQTGPEPKSRANLAGPRAVLVLDLGQSWIKRAWAHYQDGRLVELSLLPRQRSVCDQIAAGPISTVSLEQQSATLVDLIAESWRTAQIFRSVPQSHVVISLAAYLCRGQPCRPDDSCYGRLAYLSDDLPAYLAGLLSRKLGRPMSLTLLHDGTAAASVFAGHPLTAVIAMGTALGIGFPPAGASGLCTVADDLVVDTVFKHSRTGKIPF